MKSSQRLKRCFLASIICTLVMIVVPTFSYVTVPTALASTNQTGIFTDSTPSLVSYPSQLNEQNCQISNNRTWACVVTLYGENLAGIIVFWNAYPPNSSISISPSKGVLVELAPTIRVTISNIPCMNAYFLISGQIYGGGGVIPAIIPWSCIPKPTPVPTHQPTSIPIPQPSPTAKIKVSTPTPVATRNPRPTPTMTSLPTSVISSDSHSDPPVKANDNSSANIFLVSASIFLVLESCVAIVLIGLLIRRKIFKM